LRDYIDGIPAEHRPLFDRLHPPDLEAHPEAAVVISYKIPTIHGPVVAGSTSARGGMAVSLYGWRHGSDAGFASRHRNSPQASDHSGQARRRRAIRR